MTHKEKCKCVNCKAKGSPLKEIFIKDVTAEDLSNIEILDWLEGWGQVMSLSSQKFIRKYGFLLAKLQDNPQWDATDAAHPAWWRGEKWSAHKAAKLIANILMGNDTGKGAMNEPVGGMRDAVLELKQEYEAARSLWVNAQKACKKHALRGDALEKENEGCWDRVHNLEEENGRYWERIGELEAEILTLKSRSQA